MIGIDLFSGAGGMSLGAKYAGIDVQIVVESDPNAVETYKCNHQPKICLHNDDIRKYSPIPLENPNKEQVILFGGPPCQGFSTSNQKTRTSANQTNWLFLEFLRVVKAYMPEWVVFENVKGILETEKGIFVKEIIKSLSEYGYNCNMEVLKATDYGVPQKRERLFIVGSLNSRDFSFPEKITTSPVTVAEAISDLPILQNGASQCFMPYKCPPTSQYASKLRNNFTGCKNHLVTKNSNNIIERYTHIPPGGNWENIPAYLMDNYKDKSRCHTGIYRRLRNDMPSTVIGNYRKNMLIHPDQHRGLSVREAARLQSFPDDFVFMGSIGFQQQQVGNAVPPLLAEAIFKQISLQV
jgi:DNA (cytosine-5)-methyltransferase 1